MTSDFTNCVISLDVILFYIIPKEFDNPNMYRTWRSVCKYFQEELVIEYESYQTLFRARIRLIVEEIMQKSLARLARIYNING